MTPIFALQTVHAHPHVGGRSTRVKAEPARLTRLAALMMCASGNFTTQHRPVRSTAASLVAATALLLSAGTLVIAGDARPLEPDARFAAPVVSDQMFSLGIGEYSGPATAASDRPNAQDRFEIARLYRLTAEANQKLAPGAGPSTGARAVPR